MNKVLKVLAVVVFAFGIFTFAASPAYALSSGCELVNGAVVPIAGPGFGAGPQTFEKGEKISVTVLSVVAFTNMTVEFTPSVGAPITLGTTALPTGTVSGIVPADMSGTVTIDGVFAGIVIKIGCSPAPETEDTTAPSLLADGRFDGFGSNAAVYAGDEGIFVYTIDADGNGVLVAFITNEDLASISAPDSGYILLDASADFQFAIYLLSTGEYQVNIGPDADGKTLVVVFDSNWNITNKYDLFAE